MKLKAALASLAALFAAPAMAEVVVIDFDNLVNNVYVNTYYAGGSDSLGHVGGADQGISFVGFVTASGAGASSSPNYAYANGAAGLINVLDGFTALNFSYGTMAPATISVYSGLNGTGTLLGTGVFNGNAMAFAPGAVAFSGLAHSVRMTATPSHAALDDVAFTMAAPIPEPHTWAMLGAGLAIVFVARRRPRRPSEGWDPC